MAVWAIVSVVGGGAQLDNLTRFLHGEPVPKALANLCDGPTLLQHTLERLRPLAPPSRTLLVVAREHLALAEPQLAAFAGVEILEHSGGLSSAGVVMEGLASIQTRDAAARVVVAPAWHYVARPEWYRATLRAALAVGETAPMLLGAEATRAETDCGWIVAGPGEEAARPIERMVHRPHAEWAARLLESGALWNTGIFAGRAEVFSARVLEDPTSWPPASGLRVVPLRGSGWCDWMTPEQVVSSLEGTDALDGFLRSVVAAQRFRGRGGGTAGAGRLALWPLGEGVRAERRRAAAGR